METGKCSNDVLILHFGAGPACRHYPFQNYTVLYKHTKYGKQGARGKCVTYSSSKPEIPCLF